LADSPGNTDEDTAEKQVAEAIMEYLSEHPHAMDSVEGVAAWWLSRDRQPANLAITRRALERLVSSGLLLKVGEGERARYGMRKGLRPK
jgi:hypothetical protein